MSIHAQLSPPKGLVDRLLASTSPCAVLAYSDGAAFPAAQPLSVRCYTNQAWQQLSPAKTPDPEPQLQDLLSQIFDTESFELVCSILRNPTPPTNKVLTAKNSGEFRWEYLGEFRDAEAAQILRIGVIEAITPASSLATRDSLVLESVIEGRAVVSHSGTVLECNELFLRMMDLKSRTPDISLEQLIPQFSFSGHGRTSQPLLACSYEGRRFSVECKTAPLDAGNVLLAVLDLSQQTLLRNRMRAAVEGANIGLWEIDLQTGKVRVSQELLAQLGEEDEWRSLADFESRIHPQDREHIMAAFAQAIIDPEQSYEQIVRLRHVDGDYRHILTKGQFYSDPEENGGAVKAFGMHLDISNQVKTEQDLKHYTKQLEKRNEELDSFAHAASHDLRSPVRTIRYLVDWIESDCKDSLSDSSLSHFSNLKTRLNRMDRLLVDLLAYSKIGRSDLQREEIDCRKVIREICDDEIDSKLFEFETSEFMPTFETSATPLKQVLRNLVSNAIKHHPKTTKFRRDKLPPEAPGQISITCEPEDQFFRFSISDDGNGIHEKYHEKIFEFFQTLQSRDEVEGSGLGLSMVRKAIESQGGEISISSAEGRGATFTFTWPQS